VERKNLKTKSGGHKERLREKKNTGYLNERGGESRKSRRKRYRGNGEERQKGEKRRPKGVRGEADRQPRVNRRKWSIFRGKRI